MNVDVALAGFVLAAASTIVGLAFHAGRMSVRVEGLETWRAEVKQEFRELHGHIDRLVIANELSQQEH